MTSILIFPEGKSGKLAGAAGDRVRTKAVSAFMSLQIVTVAAHSLANVVLEVIPPVVSDDPDRRRRNREVALEVAALRGTLDAAKVTAILWLPEGPEGGLCARLCSAIPDQLLAFGATYRTVSSEILDLLQRATAPGSSPVLAADVLGLVGVLARQVRGFRLDLQDAKARLNGYTAQVRHDHGQLVGGAEAIQTLSGIDRKDADALACDIARLHSKVDALSHRLTQVEIGTGVGICVATAGVAICFVPGGQGAGALAIVVGAGGVVAGATLWRALEAQIRGTQNRIKEVQSTRDQLTQQAIALTGLHMVAANLIAKVESAQAALADLGVFWSRFELALQSLLDDLGQPNAELGAILTEAFVQSAQNSWDELAVLATHLLDVEVTVEYRPVLPCAPFSRSRGPRRAAQGEVSVKQQ